MNRRLLIIIAIFIIFSRITIFAQEKSKMGFDFFATNGYLAQNNNFLLKSNEVWKDYLSSIGGDVTYSGGKFAESQYELSLRYTTTFSQPHNSNITLKQLYIQTPLTDYTFLTVGKRVKKYGLAAFHNFSNRLSPEERVLGRLERLIRRAPGLIQFDWIASSHISLGTFLWSDNVQKWEDMNIGAQTEINLDNIYGGFYLYYEKLNDWLIGINISDQIGAFRVYGEGIIKEKNEQYFPEVLNFKNINATQISFSSGLAWEWRYYSARLEYANRSEGYNKGERGKIKDLIRDAENNFDYYNKSYFSKNYFGISLGTMHFILTNLSVNVANLISLDSIGGELNINLAYIHREEVVFGVNFLHYYGKKDSEYILYVPYQSQINAFVMFCY